METSDDTELTDDQAEHLRAVPSAADLEERWPGFSADELEDRAIREAVSDGPTDP